MMNDIPLLERDEALASLREHVAHARGGSGRLVLIAGEAGVGKTALVERLRQDLPDVRWWWARCDGLFTPRPLAPLKDLADQWGGTLADLIDAGADREELFRALLRQIGAPGSLDVLVVEDVHWADDATLDMLRFLSRRLEHTPAMLIVTYRDDDLASDAPLRVALGDFGSQRLTRRLSLAPLSHRAVEALAAGTGLMPDDLHRLTGGSPFFLTEVLRAGRMTGAVPVSARDVVLARAARLSVEARQVLDVAALTGARIEVRLLEAVTKHPTTSVDELLTSGLLVDDAAGLRFRHEIARLAVAQAVPAHRAQRIHRLLLSALRSGDCDDEARLAFHAEEAGDAESALGYAVAAARRAARLGSHREAAAQYERALRCAADADVATVAGLHEGLADEVALLDRWQEAEAAVDRALVLWREAGDQVREGDALRRLARIRWVLCRGSDALAAARAAVVTLEPLGDSTELARAYAALAFQRMVRGEYEAAIDLALRAQALATRFDATDVLSDALDAHGASASQLRLEWTGLMHRALAIALAGNHHNQAARTYTNLGTIHACRREFAEAERCLDEGLKYCAEHDITTYASFMRGERSSILERTGRWDEAIALSENLVAEARPSQSNRLRALIRLGLLRARRGAPGAWDCLDEAAEIGARSRESLVMVMAYLARAEAYWLEGRMPQAVREAELADDVCTLTDAWHRGEVAVWLARTGSKRSAPDNVAPPYQAMLDGEPARSAALWTELGCPYEAAMALAFAPNTSDETALRDALRTFVALDAGPAARIARQRLRALGARSIRVGPNVATRSHPLGLTQREQEVLDLLRASYSNLMIAEKLFISKKTVDHHVSAILRKLGVPNRGAAADHASMRDIADLGPRPASQLSR